MRIKVIWIVISFVVILATTCISCANTTSSTTSIQPSQPSSNVTSTPSVPVTTASPPATTSSTTGNWWDKLGTPQYGGTLTFGVSNLSNVSFDPGNPNGLNNCIIYERLFNVDWTMNRNQYAFTTDWIPSQYWVGQLAQSWKQTDPLTITVQLKQGIHWQNKPPVNGREFVANDVQQHYDRLLGTGSYTVSDPFLSGMISNIQQVVATDKYTVQFKFKTASVFNIYLVFGTGMGDESIESPEWAQQYGMSFVGVKAPTPPPPGAAPPPPPAGGGNNSANTNTSNDWKTAVSTGPWTVAEFVNGSSLSFNKNPDYWGYDERYPSNKLPYLDTFKEIAIPDMATSLAALRTGKVDLLADPRNAPTYQEAQNLAKTNPEINQTWWPSPGYGLYLRCDTAPFNDINVRKALQLAINNNQIAQSQFGGSVPGTPSGLVSPLYTGWVTPYDQWPTNLQQEYNYNPNQAKTLLANAGYPNGFNTDVVASSQDNLNILQIIKSEFSDINVNMTINSMDPTVEGSYVRSGKYDQMAYGDPTGALSNPYDLITNLTSKSSSNVPLFFTDSKYDNIVSQLQAATTENDIKNLINQANMYALQQHWTIMTFPISEPVVLMQSRIKGYSGDLIKGGVEWGFYGARFWAEQTSK